MRFGVQTQTVQTRWRSFFFNYTREMWSICTRHRFDVTFETHEQIDSVDTNKRSVGQQKMCYKHAHMHSLTLTHTHMRARVHTPVRTHTTLHRLPAADD